MTFDEYQELASRTLPTMSIDDRLTMLAMGLAGEAGEALEMVKKHRWHGHGLDCPKLVKELGDVLWYASQLAAAIGVDFDEVAVGNIDKLRARYPEGFSKQASRKRVESDQ